MTDRKMKPMEEETGGKEGVKKKQKGKLFFLESQYWIITSAIRDFPL